MAEKHFARFLALITSLLLLQPTNGLQFTLDNTIIRDQATTINYVTESGDPSKWILRNVYANGTTQIGGILSGTGSVSFTFQLTGPHFLQAVAYNDTTSSAVSQPFYTGNLFTPIDTSSSSSTATSGVITASCSATTSASADAVSSGNSTTGAVVGGVVGGLGFLSALIFFGLWFRLRRDYKRKPNFGQVVQRENPNGGALAPLMMPSSHLPPSSIQATPPASTAPASSAPPTDRSSSVSGPSSTVKRRPPATSMSSMPMMPESATMLSSPERDYSQAHLPSMNSQDPAISRELSELRMEVQRLRQETRQIHDPPPDY
ncbi:hypothetical protein GYMLUDRAFT_34490 [Collybiopsis luxurians FD-317 M1]|nr:hypothetical protein GYMLUDRAFT_34490 [Collybiopsis luxurians FD-317 M1]